MTDMPPKLNRRWFQFSLRTLLIVTTIIAMVIGWLSYKVRQQREAVAALEKAGSVVMYDYRRDLQRDRPLYWPKWLVETLGVDYFANVVCVDFRAGATNAELKIVTNLPALDAIVLKDAQVSDEGLAHLKGLASLERLSLDRSVQISDAGMENVNRIAKLEYLVLDDTQITDVGLDQLRNVRSLHFLWLHNTNVTDAGVARLQQSLPDCRIFR